MQLSIVIPCYNEEGCIEEVVISWVKEISSQIPDFRLILINDGSKDRTGEILESLKSRYSQLDVVHQENRGHGPALLHGYRQAMGDWVFHTDSDNQFVPSDFWSLWKLRAGTSYVIGYRKNRNDPWHRLVITNILRFIVNILLGVPVRDSNIPYKLIRRDLLQKLLPLIPDDTFAPSILLALGAERKGVSFKEVPVQHLPRRTGKTVLHPLRLSRACIKSFFQLLAFDKKLAHGG